MTYQPKENIPCKICGSPSVARKLCRPCYCRHWGKGEHKKYEVIGPKDIFWERVEKKGSCWNWTRHKNSYGYGIFVLPGDKKVRAHRHAYELTYGKIPKGLVIMHSCDNPACINPKHLKAGTKLENNRDSFKKGRNAFGEKNGHARLTSAQVESIRSDKRTQTAIALDYGVCPSHISRIKSHEVWQHVE